MVVKVIYNKCEMASKANESIQKLEKVGFFIYCSNCVAFIYYLMKTLSYFKDFYKTQHHPIRYPITVARLACLIFIDMTKNY